MDKNMFNLAQCLYNHPIGCEKNIYKIKYLNVLEYFNNKFSKDDEFSQGMLNVYKEKFINKAEYSYNEKEIKKAFKSATKYKIKGFKLFTYRYNLLFDCFFINAFNDKEKAKKILEAIKNLFNPRYHKKLELIFNVLYMNDTLENFRELSEQIKMWKLNEEFLKKDLNKILVTANMSAGKSTLINALVGKKINRTQNLACTAKVHYIFNKPYEDYLSYEWDYEMNLDADTQTLMEDNEQNSSTEIYVGTYFNTKFNNNRICLIDTPGVNSSENKDHKLISENFIKNGDYDKLIYVIDGENMGRDDDRSYLNFIFENVKDKEIVFVINKLDTFVKDEDSLEDKLMGAKKELEEIGFEDPVIYPLSAQVAMLAKKKIEELDESELFSIEGYKRRFKEKEYKLVSNPNETEIKFEDYNEELLYNSGFQAFENLITK